MRTLPGVMLLAGALALLSGCSLLGGSNRAQGRRGEAGAPVGEAGAAAGDGGAGAPVDGEGCARCREAWERARKSLEVHEIAAPAAPLRWKIQRGCNLRYEFQTESTMRIFTPTSERTVGLAMLGGVDGLARPEGEPRLVLRNDDIEMVPIGVMSPQGAVPTQPRDGLPPIVLRTDGRSLSEVDGPAPLWAGFGAWPGLVLDFPTLPEGAEAGSEGTWEFPVYRGIVGSGVEARPGTAKRPPDGRPVGVAPRVLEAKVRLLRWIDVAGQPAAVFAARWEERLEPANAGPDGGGGEAGASVEGSYEARYVVLASGRLFHAAIDGAETVSFPTPGGSWGSTQRHQLWSESRLRSACEGPTAAAFEPLSSTRGGGPAQVEPGTEAPAVDAGRATGPPPDAGRSVGPRAMETYRRFHAALLEGDQRAVEAQLHPRLVAAHPAGAVYRLLREHLVRHGEGSIVFSEDAQVAGVEGASAVITASSRERLVYFSNATVETEVTAVVDGDQVLILSLRSSIADRDDGDLLELSPSRLYSRAAGDY